MKYHKSHSIGAGRQAGLASVEMAISLAVMLLMLLATAEFGRMFYQYNDLTKAVGTAARYMSKNALSTSGAFHIADADITMARNLVVYGAPAGGATPRLQGLSANQVQVTGDGTSVTVSVAWQYVSIFGGTIPNFGLGEGDGINTALTLSASSSMRAVN